MDVEPVEITLDACSLLNLIATRRFGEIAQAIPAMFVVERRAANEVRYIRRGGSGPDALDREPIDLGAIETDGFLAIEDLTTPDELADFVAFAVEMDDGEAATGALARARGVPLVSDDRKARRVFSILEPPLSIRTTSEIIKAWADRKAISTAELADVLLDVETRARFRPGANDPLFQWWESARVG
jgi:predicted nucleic acid-binding protein